MSVDQSLIPVKSSDILVYLLPGLLAIIGLSIFVPPIYDVTISVESTLLIAIVTILATTIGKLANSDAIPRSFRRRIIELSGNDTTNEFNIVEKLANWTDDVLDSIRGSSAPKHSVLADVWPVIYDSLNIEEDFDNWTEVYQMITIKLENQIGARAKRFETLYLFGRNTLNILYFLSLAYILTFVLEELGATNIYNSEFHWIFLYLIILIMELSILMWIFTVEYGRKMTDELLMEYYLEFRD